MHQHKLTATLAQLQPQDLWPVWCNVYDLEQQGRLQRDEAERLRQEIYAAMLRLGLEPDDVLPAGHGLD